MVDPPIRGLRRPFEDELIEMDRVHFFFRLSNALFARGKSWRGGNLVEDEEIRESKLGAWIYMRDTRNGGGIGWVKSFLRFLLRSMTVQVGIVRTNKIDTRQ